MQQENNLRILIIDDSQNIHEDFIKVLSTNKKSEDMMELELKIFSKTENKRNFPTFRIDHASQGLEGIDLVEKACKANDPYALAFVDVRMPPGIDGVETIERIWKIDPDVQIVICTAYSDYSWERMTDKLGEHENLIILKKPFDSIAVRQISVALTKKWLLLHESRSHMMELETKVAERTAELNYQATHDNLTDLPNRQAMMRVLQNSIERSERNMSLFAVLFIDIDRFKWINDSFSHAAGDELLRQFSNRIQNNMRQGDFLSRWGGDEFILILNNIKNSSASAIIAKKLLQKLADGFVIEKHNIVALPSIGISVFPYNGKDCETLLKNADAAMYQAKEKGGNQFHFYTDQLEKVNITRLEMEAELHRAIKNNEFFLCYQPQYNYLTNKIFSVEALIRWNHPKKGCLHPIDFVPLAEDVGLFGVIGEWILKTACTQTKTWQDQGIAPIKMCVNVTTHQFMQSNFVENIKNVLEETTLDPQYLELELTENIMIHELDAPNKLARLRALGVSIAMDDFGTGYSSLSYLRNLPLDKIKIDRSYIQNININKSDEVIIQAIITMAKSLGLDVIAEGVETKKQLEFLQERTCTEIQGFYFSKPLETKECTEFLQKSFP